MEVTNRGAQPLGRAAPPAAHHAAEGPHLHGAVQDARRRRRRASTSRSVRPARRTASSGSCCSTSTTKPQVYLGHVHDGRRPTIPASRWPSTWAASSPRTTPAPFTVCIDDVRLDDPQYVAEAGAGSRRRSRTCWSTRSATSRRWPRSRRSRTPERRWPGSCSTRGARSSRRARRIPFGADAASGDQVSIADFSAYAEQGDRLHAAGRRRRQPPVRHPRRHLHASSSTTRSRSSTSSAAASRSRCRTRATRSGRARPATSASSRTTATRACPARRAAAATTRSTSAAAGTTPATTASTSSTAASRSGRCSTSTSARRRFGTSAADFGDGKMNIPENKNKRPRPARRGALGAGVRAQDAGAGGREAGRAWSHHKIHDAKWTALALRPARGPDAALPAAAEHGGDAEPGGERRAGGAHLAARSTRRSPSGAWRRPSAPGRRRRRTRRSSRRHGGERRRPLRRQERRATSSTGRRPSSTSRPRRPSTRTFVIKSEHFKKVDRRLERQPGHADVDDLGRHAARSGSISLAIVPNGLPARTTSTRSARTSIAGGRRATWTLIGEAGLPRCRSARRQEGLPVGLELVRAQQRADASALAHDFTGDAQVPERRRRWAWTTSSGATRSTRATSPATASARSRTRTTASGATRPTPKYPPPPPGVLSGGPNSGLQDPYVQAAGLGGLRAAEVLRRQHRGLVGQRGHHQLERAAGLGGRVPRREGGQGGKAAAPQPAKGKSKK